MTEGERIRQEEQRAHELARREEQRKRYAAEAELCEKLKGKLASRRNWPDWMQKRADAGELPPHVQAWWDFQLFLEYRAGEGYLAVNLERLNKLFGRMANGEIELLIQQPIETAPKDRHIDIYAKKWFPSTDTFVEMRFPSSRWVKPIDKDGYWIDLPEGWAPVSWTHVPTFGKKP